MEHWEYFGVHLHQRDCNSLFCCAFMCFWYEVNAEFVGRLYSTLSSPSLTINWEELELVLFYIVWIELSNQHIWALKVLLGRYIPCNVSISLLIIDLLKFFYLTSVFYTAVDLLKFFIWPQLSILLLISPLLNILFIYKIMIRLGVIFFVYPSSLSARYWIRAFYILDITTSALHLWTFYVLLLIMIH